MKEIIDDTDRFRNILCSRIGSISILKNEYNTIYRFNTILTKIPMVGLLLWLRLHTTTAGSMGSIPGQGTKIPYAMQPKKPTNKQ